MFSKSIALIHDWFISIGGAEKVTKEIYFLLNNPHIYTLISNKLILEKLNINPNNVKAIFRDKPLIQKIYKILFPLYPILIEQIDLSTYDILISSSHFVAKGILRKSNQIHICYCHTPPRYLWDLYFTYKNSLPLTLKLPFSIFAHYLRMWDYYSSQRVDYFIANSKYVAKRIKKFYGKDATVIYPPVDVDKFKVISNKEDYFVTASRLVKYKNVDLIVKAFTKLRNKKLIVIGEGEEMKRLKKIATKNVEFLGFVADKELEYYLSHAKAFIYAAEEDFGLLPVEAQACGTPVIAYGKGGVLESVVENKTGIFYYKLTVDDIIQAINKFEKNADKFDPYTIRKNAERFSVEVFQRKFIQFLNNVSP